ncbi:hypothetical protein HGRIS_014389 [Hohenbuehelia grisea]|uniref:Citrate transporter-like domain-containing protein n=1 Tax=Hohenbuehelia grisea TaxID=104357 RepID=A0ABR3JU49_9AGAR
MITGKSIATLVIFILSIFFVIHPVSWNIPLPRYGKRRFVLGLSTAPIIAIAILWAAQCLGPAQIRHGIVGLDGIKPYNILILFFSLAYMAITLDITGILQSAAFWVSNKGGSNGYKLFFYFYLLLTGISVVLGNDPIILSGTAFLVYYTKVAELNPTSWLMAEFAAANTASMVLFVGNPTNVVICEGFRVQNAAFTAYTILPFLACITTCFIALAVQFRDKKYVPRKLEVNQQLDVRSVLLDPVGAWFGSILLGSCLAVIIVVSFFGVDVWKISLPFAAAKFIYDICWDHYRYVKGIPMLGRSHPKRKRSDDSQGSDDKNVLEKQLARRFSHAPGSMSEPTSRETTLPISASPTMVAEPGDFKSNILPIHRTTSPVPEENDEGLEAGNSKSEKDAHMKPKSSPSRLSYRMHQLSLHFPTFFTALPRLPFALVPFAFSQFILIEALSHQGWIELFATWLVRATNRQMHPTIWLVGVLGVILCNLSGTNIGATILLTKVVRAAALPPSSDRAGAIALAVASNIGAVSFTFSASLAGLLWRAILKQKGILITQTEFAKWNVLPILVMTAAGLAVVSAEMAVLY